MSNTERYKKANEINLSKDLIAIRTALGELPDFRSPSEDEIRNAIDEIFPSLLENEKRKLCDEFIKSEQEASDQADQDFAQAA